MWLGLLALAAGSALAAPQRYEMRSYVDLGGKIRPAFAWCDTPNRVLAVTQPTVPRTVENSVPVTLAQWVKGTGGVSRARTAPYLLGPSEGAAGSLYDALIPPGRTPHSEAASQFFVRTSNVENTLDPAYRMTHVNEFRMPEGSFRCRYQPQAVFMGATARRTVIVWRDGEKLTYATRNFDGTPGVQVTYGQVYHQAVRVGSGGDVDLSWLYVWEAPGGYSYGLQVSTSASQGDPSPSITVRKDGKTLLREPFLAFSVSFPRGSVPSLLDLFRRP